MTKRDVHDLCFPGYQFIPALHPVFLGFGPEATVVMTIIQHMVMLNEYIILQCFFVFFHFTYTILLIYIKGVKEYGFECIIYIFCIMYAGYDSDMNF